MIAIAMVVALLLIDVAVILWCARMTVTDYEYGSIRENKCARRNKVTGEVQYLVMRGWLFDWWETEMLQLWPEFVAAKK